MVSTFLTQLATFLVYTASFDQCLALLNSFATQYDKVRHTTPYDTLKNDVSMYHTEVGNDVRLYYDDEMGDLVFDELNLDLDQWLMSIHALATHCSHLITCNTTMDPSTCLPDHIHMQKELLDYMLSYTRFSMLN